ncbi:hypothetical protein SLEP1_g36064 [Rubroshorea leprosula]|nr:hypothetical protein SLEP1_g36064 [Rubroshorea leprosula]
MITGGLEAGGLSSKQRKLYVREVKHQNRAQKRKIDDAKWKTQPITFTSADLDTVVTPHNDPLVTSVIINNCEVQRVLVDTGSAPDIMYFHCFESLGLDPALLQKYDGPIYGFNNQPVPVEGVLTLHVAFRSGRTYVTPSVQFLVVKMASSFNIVIGRPTLTEIRVVVSQSHLCMKFPTPMGIATLRGNQEVARHCYITSVTQPTKGKDQTPEAISQQIPNTQQVMGVEIVDNRPEDETRAAPVEDVEEVLIVDRDPSRKTQIGTRLNPEERAELIAFLRANNDVFAWTSADMPEIPKSVSQHKLNTNPLKKPVAQKRRLFGGERLQAIKEEVEKLLQAGFVRKVDYCEWVANPVLVKKANGKWQMCIDYTNRNLVDYCPNQIVADNGTQFNCSSFRDFCSSYGIKLQFTSVYHPESNGMVESVNKCILEVKEEARLRTLVYKQKLASFYNKWVRPRTFKVGDLVLRKAGLTGFETRFGKLAPNWEGPYAVADVPHPGAYVLQDAEVKRVPRVWNVNNLKKFYP